MCIFIESLQLHYEATTTAIFILDKEIEADYSSLQSK